VLAAGDICWCNWSLSLPTGSEGVKDGGCFAMVAPSALA
jgi:hypothetical protein